MDCKSARESARKSANADVRSANVNAKTRVQRAQDATCEMRRTI